MLYKVVCLNAYRGEMVIKGNCLERFLAVSSSVIDFFNEKDSILAGSLLKRKIDIVYMSNLYGKFNCLN